MWLPVRRGDPCARILRAALGALILLAASPGLDAQTLPLPALPQEPPPEDPAGVDPAAPPGAAGPDLPSRPKPRAWDYDLGIGAGWDSNVTFQAPNALSSWLLSPRGSLARLFSGRKGDLRLGARGDLTSYPNLDDVDTYDLVLSAEGSYRSSVETTWKASGSYDMGYSDSALVLSDQGVLLPLVKARTLAGALGVTRQLGQRTALRMDARLYRTVFDEDPTEVTTVPLADGQSIRATAAIERKRAERDSLAFEYSLERTRGRTATTAVDGEASTYHTHYSSLQWTHILSPRQGILLEAGASYTPASEEAGLSKRANFYGGASYSRQVKRSSLTVFARREVAPAFGLGFSRLESRFGLNATIPLNRAWTLRLTGIHVVPETPEDAPARYASPDEAFVTLGRRLGRAFELSTEARYRRRGGTDELPVTEGLRAGIFLTLLGPSARKPAPETTR